MGRGGWAVIKTREGCEVAPCPTDENEIVPAKLADGRTVWKFSYKKESAEKLAKHITDVRSAKHPEEADSSRPAAGKKKGGDK